MVNSDIYKWFYFRKFIKKKVLWDFGYIRENLVVGYRGVVLIVYLYKVKDINVERRLVVIVLVWLCYIYGCFYIY